MAWLLAIAAVLGSLAVWGAIAAHRAAKARQTALAGLAKAWGVRFTPGRQADPDRRFPGHAWFAQGDDRWLTNSLAGEADIGGRAVALHAGDFTYEEHREDADGDRSTSTHRRSYLLVDLRLPTPSLCVRPEGLGDKLKGLLGFRDVEFESAAFNSRFHVRASDKKFAYDVFHARAQEWLMAAPFRQFELVDGALLVPGGEPWAPEVFARARSFAVELLDGWPAFVWDRLAARVRG